MISVTNAIKRICGTVNISPQYPTMCCLCIHYRIGCNFWKTN